MIRFVAAGVGMAAVLALSSVVGAHPGHQQPAAPSAPGAASSGVPTRDAVTTAAMFATALTKGDEITVKGLLAEDVVIYESGGQESSREEYAAHHMKADMAFLAGSKIEILDRKHGESGDLAWVLTRSRISGAHDGKPFDLYSTESLVLKRAAGAWKIVHIHWSSQPVARSSGER
jgi:ketosteroid isomerase-like protein